MAKKNSSVLIVCSLVALSLVAGCAKKSTTPAKEDDLAKLQGTWIGPESGSAADNWTFTFSGGNVNVSGPSQEAYKGTVVLNSDVDPKQVDFVIEECSLEEYVGKTSLGIYELQDDKVSLAATEPGVSTRPASFEEKGDARLWILTKQ